MNIMLAPSQDRLPPAELMLPVGGMHCGGCAATLEAALRAVPGIALARVDFARGQALLQATDPRVIDAARAVVVELGFTTDRNPLAPDVAGLPTAFSRRGHPRESVNAAVSARETIAIGESRTQGRRTARTELLRVLLAWFAMMQVMMFAYPAYVADAGTLSSDAEQLLRLASLVVTAPTLWFCGGPIVRRALGDLRRGALGMDVPVALGLMAAFIASLVAISRATGDVYFDSITMFLAFLLTARWVEAKGRAKAVAQIEALANQAPQFARRLPHYPGREGVETVPIDALRQGDFVVIENGDYVPADGSIVHGETRLDEAWLTGEAHPVKRAVAAEVLAGAINVDQPVIVRVNRVGDATELSMMLKLMQRAALEKPAIATLADRIAGRFVAVVLLLALMAAAYWMLNDPPRALPVALAVLVVSCPCALSLALPVALVAAQGNLARQGLLLTRGRALEALASADRIVFDKTGTLTFGRVRVVAEHFAAHAGRDVCAPVILALEDGVSHPMAKALAAWADAVGQRAVCESQSVVNGEGVEGVVDGVRYRLGRLAYAREIAQSAIPAQLQCADTRGSAAYLACDGEWLAAFVLDDDLRPDSAAAISALKQAGLSVSILSGDRDVAVRAVAKQLGVDDWHALLTPQEKHAALKSMQAKGEKVAMIGDGVNDGPVLAQANVSVVMGSGAPLAQRHGDLVLMGERLMVIVAARALAQKASRVIRQNLLWAFAYNVVAIPLALTGQMPPAVAAIGMSMSSLLVVANALRLVSAQSHRSTPDTAQPRMAADEVERLVSGSVVSRVR